MISVWGMTDKGMVRKHNQDACSFELIGEQDAWGVVCDGMGGAKAGDIASRMAVEIFEKYVREHGVSETMEENATVLRMASEEANGEIFKRASDDFDCHGMGTTLVGLMIHDDQVTVANVGDSRAYSVSKGEIKRITRDHSVVEDLVQKGELTPDEARVHPQKNLITRAIGTAMLVRTDLYHITLHTGDALLLCSDGLINEVTEEEIQDILTHEQEPKSCCQYLISLALARGAQDNVTAVIFRT
ncbi:MAG: Stp1/IreP family PP2C-type Ser/Thr phosphatase [Evtepia sp.]